MSGFFLFYVMFAMTPCLCCTVNSMNIKGQYFEIIYHVLHSKYNFSQPPWWSSLMRIDEKAVLCVQF